MDVHHLCSFEAVRIDGFFRVEKINVKLLGHYEQSYPNWSCLRLDTYIKYVQVWRRFKSWLCKLALYLMRVTQLDKPIFPETLYNAKVN